MAENKYGHVLNQRVFAYEVRFADLPPGAQWRRNRIAMVLCATVEEAIQLVKANWPDDPQIDQVVLRNKDMNVIIADSAMREGPVSGQT